MSYSDHLEANDSFDEKNTGRTRADRRKMNTKKARRKQKIAKEVHNISWYDNLHEYSKGKIHCSCPICSEKTNRVDIFSTKHRRKKNYKHSEVRKITQMDYDEKERSFSDD